MGRNGGVEAHGSIEVPAIAEAAGVVDDDFRSGAVLLENGSRRVADDVEEGHGVRNLGS